jgi:hypothetical protein
MFNKEMFLCRKGKIVNVVVSGSCGALPGKVVDCSDSVLTLSTRWSSQQFIALETIQNFWCSEDTPED